MNIGKKSSSCNKPIHILRESRVERVGSRCVCMWGVWGKGEGGDVEMKIGLCIGLRMKLSDKNVVYNGNIHANSS